MSDDLESLARDLTAAPERAARNVRKALQVTSHSIKDDWRQAADRSGLSGYAAQIDYELQYPGGAIESLIGPKLGGQGSLGLVEDAGGDVRSAPQHAGRDALRANEDDFYRGLEIAILDPLE